MKSANVKRLLSITFVFLFALAGQSSFPQIGPEPPFVRNNLPSFGGFSLSNGIPVYIKLNKANRVRNISLVLQGGSLVARADQAGWEKIALAAMARASANYPYETVTALLDDTSSAISSGVQFEYATFSLNALDKYFDRLLPIWGDMIINPAFDKTDFDQAKSEAELTLQSKEQDPWSVTGKMINEKYFSGHPYAISPDGTEATVSKATAEDIKQWYNNNMSADRIFVVAVGDIDAESLRPALEATIGKLPNLALGAAPAAPAFGRGAPGRLFTEDNDQSKGTVYLRGDFAAPSPGAPDYMAANVAMKLFSDLLFSIVRDRYGAVYTPSAAIRSFGANYGSIAIYKTSAADKIKAYIDETASIFASGLCVSVDPTRPGEEAKFMKIADALDTYKRMFTNEYFDAIRTNAAVAGLIIRSVTATGDPSDWVRDVVRIAAVTPEEVVAAFSTYILGGSFTWVAVGDPGLIATLPAGDFASFKLR